MSRLALLALCLVPGATAWADARPATLIGAAGGGKSDIAIVGSLGEVYVRAGGVWRRHGGGVAATLVRAWGPRANEIWAVGARPPPYAHDGKAWVALPGASGTSGPALLAEPGSTVPAVAIGRRIFVIENGKLVAAVAAPGLPTALWAQSPRDLSVIVDGKLQHFAGSWKPVAGAEENLVVLGPRVALGTDGGVYVVESRLRKLAVDAALAGFHPRLVAAGNRTVLAGALGDGYAVAAIDGRRVILLGKLPGLARADEPVGLVAGDALTVVSRSGLVLSGDGQTWKTEAIASAVAETPHAAEPPAPIQPAPDAGARP